MTRDEIARAIEPYLRIYVLTATGALQDFTPAPGDSGPLVDYIEQRERVARMEGEHAGMLRAAGLTKNHRACCDIASAIERLIEQEPK